MWPEYGGALFWRKDGGCCGDCNVLFTEHNQLSIDVSQIEGLKEWYKRFDDDSKPPYTWSTKVYKTWVDQGWEYAYAVRNLLPDYIDMYYLRDEKGKPYPVTRNNHILPCKEFVSEDRLLNETFDQIYNGIVYRDAFPYIEFIKTICHICPYEELISDAHCFWEESGAQLHITWYLDTLFCQIDYGPKHYHRNNHLEEDWTAQFEIREKNRLDGHKSYVNALAGGLNYENNEEVKWFFDTLAWYILDRGMK